MLQVIVDRVQIDGDLRARLTDSIETAYAEGGGAAFALEIARDDARPLARHVFSERFECRRCGIAYEDPQPRLFSFNNPVRRLRHVPRLRQRHRARHGSRRARWDEVAAAGRHRAVDASRTTRRSSRS